MFRSSGKSCFDATRPPHIISDRSSVSRAFIPAGWKWSLWLLFFGLLPSISPQFRWLCSVGDAAARLQRRPKVSISHHVQPHEPSYSTRTPVKYTPHHPTYLDTFPFFLTSIAPLFPILPALTVSVWVFCWVKNALALSHFRALCLLHPLFLCFFPTFQCDCVWWAQAVESVS